MKVVITSPALAPTPDNAARLLSLTDQIVTVTDRSSAGILAAAHDADALVVGVEQIPADLIAQLSRTKIIVRAGVGFDVVDVAAATEHGIQVCNVPDANHREVAAHAAAMILALTRKLPQWDRNVRSGGYGDRTLATDIHRAESQKLGVLGLGRIGRHVAEIGRAVGYQVQGYDPIVEDTVFEELGVTRLGLHELIASSNILSLHLPLTAENYHLLNRDTLSSMPPGSYIVNVSRGGLIDEHALADLLSSGHLAGAGIDTYEGEPPAADHPLRTMDNVISSPHAAHWSAEAWAETLMKTFDEVARSLTGEPPRSPVNQPRIHAR